MMNRKLQSVWMNVFAWSSVCYYDLCTMKQKLWLTLITCLAYCIDKELYQAIDYLREQVRVLVEHQEKQDKRIMLTNSQRMRVAAKAKRLSRKMLERCTELFTVDTIMRWHRKLIAEKYDGSQNRAYAGRLPSQRRLWTSSFDSRKRILAGDTGRSGTKWFTSVTLYANPAWRTSSLKTAMILNQT